MSVIRKDTFLFKEETDFRDHAGNVGLHIIYSDSDVPSRPHGIALTSNMLKLVVGFFPGIIPVLTIVRLFKLRSWYRKC